MESLPALICVGLITLVFVFPMWAYIEVTERKNRVEREKAIEAGRHEPVTIQPYVDLSLCMGAGACVTACPEHVLKLIDGQAVAVNMSSCIGHGVCVPVCPVDAITLVFGSEKRGIDIPEVNPGFETNVKGLFVAGELGGMGLIAAAAEQGVQAMEGVAKGLVKVAGRTDVLIVGAGPAGIAAALAAKKKGLTYQLVDQEEIGGAVRHYPRKKLVFTKPMDLPIYGRVNLRQLFKEELVALFEDVIRKTGLEVSTGERVDKVKGLPDGGFSVTTTKRTIEASRVVLALGRRGTPRKLDCPGEEQEKVAYSLLEPEHYQYDHLLVVGGGDSAVEAAMQLGEQPGNKVVLSYRGDKINRPKEKNIQRLRDAVKKGEVELLLESQVKEIGADRVVLEQNGESIVLPNDHVFVMVGGVLPTKFLQDAGIRIKKHFGKRIVDAEDPKDRKKGKDEAEKKPEAQKEAPPLPKSERDVATAIVEPPPSAPSDATAVLPSLADAAEVTAPRADLPDPVPAPSRTPPARSSPPEPLFSLPAPPPAGASGEATALVPSLAELADETTAPRAEPPPPLVDHHAATRVLDPSVIDAALAPVALPAGSVDEAGPLPADVERGERREVTEISSLKRAGASWPAGAPEPVRPFAPAPLAEPTPRPDGEVVGRVVAARPRPGQAPVAPTAGAPPAASARGPRAPESPPPAAEPAADEVAPASALSRGMSRAVGRPVASRPAPGAPPAEARPEPRPGQRARAEAAREEPSVVAPLVEAATKHLAEGRFAEARAASAELRAAVERGEGLPAPEVARGRRWASLVEGEALIGLGEWEAAVEPLQAAVEAARDEGSPEALGRCLWALGRALHRAERFDEAEAAVDASLQVGPRSPTEHAAALRLLGDLRLRRGEVAEAAARFEEARTRATLPDDQARAMRGLAHVEAIRGELPAALELLEKARALLGPSVEPAVLASVHARALELENVLGAWGPAMARAQVLLGLAAQKRLVEHRAEAMSLLAETLTALGLRDEGLDAAEQVGALAKHLGQRGAEARIRAARAAAELGRPDLGSRLLAELGWLTESVVDDPVGALLAVRARCEAGTDASLARDLANRALARPEPLLAFRGARIRLDASLALVESGAHAAGRAAVKQGLKVVQGAGQRGLKLELLVAMYRADPDHRVAEAVAKAALKILEDLPETWAPSFRSRPVVGSALERWKGSAG